MKLFRYIKRLFTRKLPPYHLTTEEIEQRIIDLKKVKQDGINLAIKLNTVRYGAAIMGALMGQNIGERGEDDDRQTIL